MFGALCRLADRRGRAIGVARGAAAAYRPCVRGKRSGHYQQVVLRVFGGRGGFRGFAALRFYMVTWVGERVVADLRTAIYRRVVRMDPMFYETTRVGEVLSRLTADTTLVQAIAGVNLSIVLRSTLSLIGALVLMGLTSAKLMGVILLLIPVVIVPLILTGRRVRGLSRASQDRIADTSSLADETLNAIQTVQAFTMEELQSERYAKAVEDSFATAVRRTKVRAALTGDRHHDGLRRHYLRAMAWRAASAFGHDDGRPTRAVSAVRRIRRHLGGGAHGNVGRNSTRRRCDGALERIAAGAARDSRARTAFGVARASPGQYPLRQCDVSLSIAAAASRAR